MRLLILMCCIFLIGCGGEDVFLTIHKSFYERMEDEGCLWVIVKNKHLNIRAIAPSGVESYHHTAYEPKFVCGIEDGEEIQSQETP